MNPQGTASPLAHTLAADWQLQGYRLQRVLGEGGFGIVYLADDLQLERQVAIKEFLPSAIASRAGDGRTVVVKSEDHSGTFADGLRSFLAEARMLVRFEHPALVKVHQFWEENGTAYMVMPHYAGPTLKRVLATGAPPSEADIRAWLLPLLDALEVLHADHCMHRDIAPDNIIVTPQGPVLLDFGAARRVVGDLTHALTAVLKPGYAPIEQYGSTDDMQQGPWTDLFALASVLYLAVAGVRPPAAVDRLVVDRLRPLSQVAAGRYTPAFLAAVDSAMAVLPEYRPRSVAAFRKLLEGHVAVPAATPSTPVLRRGDGVPAAQPAPTSAATPPNNLPRQRTSFIGRDEEVAELTACLDTAPLVTVLGMGGLGKTRLTLQVAASLLPRFADGAWFVDLSAVTDPPLVVGALARALDVIHEPGRPLIETVCGWLAPRRILLVVDNCEHVLQAAAEMVDAVLDAAPRVQVLASSRQLLDVPGEQAYPLRPLPLPGNGDSAATVLETAAVRMFTDRARAHRPDFRGTVEDAPLLAEVLRRLDGIPLAIELAAAQLRTMAVADILAGLAQRFQLLAGGSRLLDPRQQTLRALVDWSYDLLAADERVVFQQLSLFAGGFDGAAATAVCLAEAPGIAPRPVAACLAALVQKSLVLKDGDDAQPRFRLLETLRDYARDRLAETDAAQAAAARHCAHFFALAKEGGRGMQGVDQGRWVQRLDRDLDNLRAAAACAQAGHAEPLIAVKLAVALTGFWILRGHTAEGLRAVDAALTLPQVLATPMARAWALYTAAALAGSQGDHATAATHLRQCLALRRTLGNPVDVAATLSTLALARLHAGDAQGAAAHEAEAQALFTAAGDGRGQAIARLHLGQIHLWTGDAQQALQELALSLTLARDVANREVEAECELTIAEAHLQRASAQEAAAAADRSLAICRDAGDQRGEASATWWLGRIALHQGRWATARPLLQQALQDFVRHDMRSQIAGCLDDICALAINDGDPARGWSLAAALEQSRLRLKLPRSPWAETRWQALLALARPLLLPADAEAAARAGRSWNSAAVLQAAMAEDAEQTRVAG